MTTDTPSPTQATLPAELAIPTWEERCEVHPDHQERIVTNDMIQYRMQEEIDDLRAALSTPSLTAMREALEEAADTFNKFAADLREEDSELHAQRIAVAELKAEEGRAALSHSKKEDGQ